MKDTCRTVTRNIQSTARTFTTSHTKNNSLSLNLIKAIFSVHTCNHFITGIIQSSESSYNGKQVEGGKYIIIGTQETYTISKGETLRTIAERFWGSRGYAAYIIAHNDFANPDNVAAGTVIKIPRLKKASK